MENDVLFLNQNRLDFMYIICIGLEEFIPKGVKKIWIRDSFKFVKLTKDKFWCSRKCMDLAVLGRDRY